MLVRPSLPSGRRHASFAQTVLACSETGASVTPWSLCTAARQLSSQAAELALRGMPRPLFRDGRLASTACHAVNQSAPRRPQRPSGPALRGFGSREGGTNGVFGGGCRPRRATDESASEAGWSERVRAARARGSERTCAERTPRARVERARPRSHGPEGARGRARGAHSRPKERGKGAEHAPAPTPPDRRSGTIRGGRTHRGCTRHPPDPG